MNQTTWLVIASWIVPSGQLLATLLIGESVRSRWPHSAIVGWIVLGLAHVTLVSFGWTGDFGGFKYLQPFMILLTAYNLWFAVRVLRARRRRQRRLATRTPRAIAVDSQPVERGVQNQLLRPLVHAGILPVEGISAGWVTMPPGHVAKAHLHRETDLVVYVVSGHAATLWGDDMTVVPHDSSAVMWIPAGVPHTAINLSQTDLVIALEVRTDPTFNTDVVMLPHLDEVVHARAEQLLLASHEDKLGVKDETNDSARSQLTT